MNAIATAFCHDDANYAREILMSHRRDTGGGMILPDYDFQSREIGYWRKVLVSAVLL